MKEKINFICLWLNSWNEEELFNGWAAGCPTSSLRQINSLFFACCGKKSWMICWLAAQRGCLVARSFHSTKWRQRQSNISSIPLIPFIDLPFTLLHSIHLLSLVGWCCCFLSLCGALAAVPAHNPPKKKTTQPTMPQLTPLSLQQIKSTQSMKLNYLISWSWLIGFGGGPQCPSILLSFLWVAH